MSILTVLGFVFGIVLLIAGADMLVRGASRLAAAFGVSSLVIGLTVVAYGTGSPELAVSVLSSFAGQPDIALGNVVGSNIANVLLVLGLSAAVAPLVVQRRLLRFDVPAMLGASVLLLLLALDGTLSRLDGIVMFALMVGYTVIVIRQSRRAGAQVREDYEEFVEEYVEPEDETGVPWYKDIVFIVTGLAGLVLGSNWVVTGAATFARLLGVSEFVIGVTVIAVGTSLPEIVTSVVAAARGERDIAVGNVVGSNLFNILAVLGITSTIAPAGISVTPDAVSLDLPVMVAVAAVCVPIFFSHAIIARWEGALLLGYYASYTLFLVLRAGESPILPLFVRAFSWILLPATALLLLGTSLHAARTGHVRNEPER